MTLYNSFKKEHSLITENPDFLNFLSIECDRLNYIQNYLNVRGIGTSVFTTGNKNHILVRFPQKQYDPTFRIKTVIAHYDRVPDTQGANDNSFAVFFLMKWAETLAASESAHNIRLIFTDGEESSEGIKSQGAYVLAEYFKKLQIDKGDIFVFDCMGRGDIPILCETKLSKSSPLAFKKIYSKLEEKASKILTSSSDKWLNLPASYSDNAGFIACGIPAVAITMLPSKEAENYMHLLMKTKAKSIEDLYKEEFKEDLKSLFPQTWFLINSKRDTVETLTGESEEIFRNILNSLAAARTPALT